MLLHSPKHANAPPGWARMHRASVRSRTCCDRARAKRKASLCTCLSGWCRHFRTCSEWHKRTMHRVSPQEN